MLSSRLALRRSAALRGVAVAAMLALSACSNDDTGPGPASTSQACAPCACPSGVVDAQLLAFLSKARATHHQADIAEQSGEPDQAIEVLDRLVQGPVPGGETPGPEVREVLADTYARLAELRSASERFDEARADVERGLKLAVRRTHFRGRLMEVRGLVEERHAKALAAAGDEPGAKAANDRALEAFEKAIEIQAYVIEQALGDAGAPPTGSGAPPRP